MNTTFYDSVCIFMLILHFGFLPVSFFSPHTEVFGFVGQHFSTKSHNANEGNKGRRRAAEKEKTSRYSKQIKTWNQNFLSHTSPPPILVCPYLPKLGKYCRFLRRAVALYPLQACAENWKFPQAILYKHSTRGENWCHRPLGGDYVKLKVTKPLRLCKC